MRAKQICMVDHHGAPCPGYQPKSKAPARKWSDVRCTGEVINRKCQECGQTFGNDVTTEHLRAPAPAAKAPAQDLISCRWCECRTDVRVSVVIAPEDKADGASFEFCSTVCYLAWHDSRFTE